MLTKEELPECPVATVVNLIGSKWKLLILRNLLQRPWRFNELKKSLEGICLCFYFRSLPIRPKILKLYSDLTFQIIRLVKSVLRDFVELIQVHRL